MGVFFNKSKDAYSVQVPFEGKRLWLGTYRTRGEALSVFFCAKYGLKRNACLKCKTRLDLLAEAAVVLQGDS